MIIVSMAISFAGCAGTADDKVTERELVSAATYKVLDHKGAAMGDNAVPKWVNAYLDGGEIAVEKLSDYKGYYCFVGTEEGVNKDMVIRWAQGVAGPALIAAQISTRLEQITEGQFGVATDEDFDQSLKQVSTSAVSATFSGARKVNDWWVRMRTYDPDDPAAILSDDYRAYVLYIIEKKQLDKQVAAELQNTIDNRKEMSADERRIFTNLIQKIMETGLGVTVD
jgi:hypothetical protein